MPSLRPVLQILFAAAIAGGLVATPGCESDVQTEEYVARVGAYQLTNAELDSALQGFAGRNDTSEARKQIIEQWVTRTLLLREALRTNLDREPSVQRRIEEQRRSVLVTALTNRLYEQAELRPSDAEIRDYFARHREQLRLREPYVRIRHLVAAQESEAEAAREALQTARSVSDSLWTTILQRYSTAPRRSETPSDRYRPESRLFARLPYVRDELSELRAGQISRVVRDDSLYHVLQVVDRKPVGSTPQVEWVEPQIRRRLRSRARKQMYAREVQRLRNEAKAQNELDVR